MQNVLQKLLLIVTAGTALIATACDSKTTSAQTQITNPASVYCEHAGGTHSVKSDADDNQAGICHFSDGQQCDEWALFRGECVPNLAIAEPFQWCAQGMNSPIMSGLDQAATLPHGLLKPMVTNGLVTPAMPIQLLKASRWRCMTGHVWVCIIGANLPCDENADLSKTPSDEVVEFCQSNPDSDVLPAYVTGRATVYEWTCKNSKPMVGNQFVEVDAAGYLSNIWHQLTP